MSLSEKRWFATLGPGARKTLFLPQAKWSEFTVALSEFEQKRIERAVAEFMSRNRPPANIRPQLDFSYRIDGQSLELFEVRPRWNPSDLMEVPIAKASYVKSRGEWKVYWQRADLKWYRYEPTPEVKSVEAFLAIVEVDEHACFFG
ncbi:DUF3024 domain-containing protein [Chromohalobacter japonicus]|uniref:DUF3024 domain-containing protein n=1 Tax=Chromohalobacter japonicus TaxID=223900 RepID=UPI00214CF2AE